MRKIEKINQIDSGWGFNTSFNITFVVPTKTPKVWQEASMATNCRSYLCNYLHASKTNIGNTYVKQPLTSFPLVKEKTYLFVKLTGKLNPDEVKKKLSLLHKWEKLAGISLTEMQYFHDKKAPGILFVGSKCWQSTLWKITIYSYLLKKVFYQDTQFDSIINKFLPILIKKVKTENRETYEKPTDGSYIHALTGFVSICNGGNRPMYKLLFGKDYIKTEEALE